MKAIQTLILGTSIGISFISCAQQTPQKVTDVFKAKYPTATHTKWENEKENTWEVEYKMNNIEHSSNFNNEGEWLETETEIKISELPAVIKNAIKAKYPTAEIEEAEKVETPKYKGYEVEIENGETEMEIVLDEKGNILEVKTEKEEE